MDRSNDLLCDLHADLAAISHREFVFAQTIVEHNGDDNALAVSAKRKKQMQRRLAFVRIYGVFSCDDLWRGTFS